MPQAVRHGADRLAYPGKARHPVEISLLLRDLTRSAPHDPIEARDREHADQNR